MSKLILHIGTHKTATTTIQKTLHKNRSLAYQSGLIYPDLPKQHHGLVADWIRLPDFYHYPAGAKAHWKSITKTNANTDKTVLISTEELSRGTPNNSVNYSELRELVSDFDEINVVCVLRDQLSLIQSVFFEVFRKHGNIGWGAYLASCLKDHLATGVYLDYNQIYDRLLQNFSDEEITFLPYRPRGQSVSPLETLLTHIGFSDLLDNIVAEDANRSAEPLSTWLSVLINRPNDFDPALAARIDPLFEKQRSSMYTQAEAKKVIDKFNPINAAFLDRYKGMAEEDLEMAPLDKEKFFFRDDLTPSKWIELVRLMRAGKA